MSYIMVFITAAIAVLYLVIIRVEAWDRLA